MGWDKQTIRQAGELLAVGGGAPVAGIETVGGVGIHIDDNPDGDIIVIMPSCYDERLTLQDGPLLTLMAKLLVSTATRHHGETSTDLDALGHVFQAWAILDPLVQQHRESVARLAGIISGPPAARVDPGFIPASSPADLTPPADTTVDPAGSVEQ